MWEVHPLIRRQLKQTLLGKLEVRERSRFSWGLSVVVFLWLMYVWLADLGRCGEFLFVILLGVGLFGAYEVPLNMTADLLIEEKRSGMYELLFLCGLQPLEVFIAKLTGAILIIGYRFLYMVPFFMLPVVGGDVSWEMYGYALVILPLILLLMLCLGMLGSAVTDEDSAARSVAKVIIIVLSALPFFVHYISNRTTGNLFIPSEWLVLSPALGPVALFMDFSAVSATLLFRNALYILLYAALALLIASVVVKRTWRLNQVKRFGQRSRFWHMVRSYLTGDATTRPAYLDSTPMRWLAGYELRPLVQAWLTMLFLIGGWVVLAVPFNELVFRIVPSVIVVIILALVYASFAAYTAARRLALDKADGQLEILLTTPVTAEEVIIGLHKGVAGQFKRLSILFYGFGALLFIMGIITRSWNWQAIVVYLMIWANVWITAQGLSKEIFFRTIRHVIVSGKPMAAATSIFSSVAWLGYTIFSCLRAFGGTTRPHGTIGELVVVFFFTLIIVLVRELTLKDFDSKLLEPAKSLRAIVAGDKVEEK